MNKSVNLQDVVLNQLRKERIISTVFLTNGFQIKGTIKGFDNFVVLVDSEGKQQLLYKHAISTIVPSKALHLTQSEE
ncbi:MAG: RNA chaperone Hfq [Candidatus Epulonipiscioides saccharophilum]|nr:RNA chaperone Hfq [Epulopiscium sp. SCG-B10WGA-EpuloB]OON93341.1 MAG: RNA chaperone Hfq [Epulopiscium sp. AS2M-Bin001]